MSKFDRLTTYRFAKGFKTAKAFAEYLGIGANQISVIDKKENPANLFLALTTKTDINLKWLETGEGEMCVQRAEIKSSGGAVAGGSSPMTFIQGGRTAEENLKIEGMKIKHAALLEKLPEEIQASFYTMMLKSATMTRDEQWDAMTAALAGFRKRNGGEE
jgi:hypothetical protein